MPKRLRDPDLLARPVMKDLIGEKMDGSPLEKSRTAVPGFSLCGPEKTLIPARTGVALRYELYALLAYEATAERNTPRSGDSRRQV